MIEFKVDDMTCGHCASTITRAVRDVDSASKCEIDLGDKRVRIQSSLSADDFKSAIEGAGYTPVVVGSKP